MALLITTQGADWYAHLILGQIDFDLWQVGLFVNNKIPTTADTVLNYTECTWPGYTRFTLGPNQWVGGASNGVASYAYPLITYLFDPSNVAQQSVFGYYVFTVGNVLLYAERFPAAFPIPPEGGEIPLLLFWVDEQC